MPVFDEAVGLLTDAQLASVPVFEVGVIFSVAAQVASASVIEAGQSLSAVTSLGQNGGFVFDRAFALTADASVIQFSFLDFFLTLALDVVAALTQVAGNEFTDNLGLPAVAVLVLDAQGDVVGALVLTADGALFSDDLSAALTLAADAVMSSQDLDSVLSLGADAGSAFSAAGSVHNADTLLHASVTLAPAAAGGAGQVIRPMDLKWYGSAVMPDDDTTIGIGGTIDTGKKPEFIDVEGAVQAVSSHVGDVTQTVTVTYFNREDVLTTAVVTLSGQVPVPYLTVDAAVLGKGVKSATTQGDVAVEAQVPTRVALAQAGGSDFIILDAGASVVDGTYEGMVARLQAGAGAGQIRQVVKYDGATRTAFISHPWETSPDVTTQVRLAAGFVFERRPAEVMQVRRPFYNVVADTPGGVAKSFYEKVIFKNAHPTKTLVSVRIFLDQDPSGKLAFGLPLLNNDSGTNGAGNNRTVDPDNFVTFGTAPQQPQESTALSAGQYVGVWLKLGPIPAGAMRSGTHNARLRGFGNST